jgi:uncharacterized protein YndB with AHSA1/START domain
MKNIKQNHTIPAEREIVFAALTNPLTIEIWSGYDAEFHPVEGTEFSLWEGDIVGKNLEIVPGELIKQQWYFDGQDEDSIVTIKLKDAGNQTSIEILHVNIPDEAFDDMKEGWNKYYFGALKKYFK